MNPWTFQGYPELSSNTTYTPNQFFDVVLPHSSRGVVRLVAYMLRKTLGWSDAAGRPQEPHVKVTYRELERRAGISHSSIRQAIEEAVAANYIRCVRPGRPDSAGAVDESAVYELCWDEREEYVTDPREFQGFFAGNGNLTYIPNAFFDITIPTETLAVIKVVGAIIRHTIGFQTKFGFRRQHVAVSFTELQRRTHIVSRRTLSEAIQQALEHNHLVRIEEGCFDPDAGKASRPATYAIKWADVADQVEPMLVRMDGTGSRCSDGRTPRFEPAGTGIGRVNLKARKGSAPKRIPGETERRSEKDTGEALRKGYRKRTEKDTERRSEKDTGLEITLVNNTPKQQQHAPRIVSTPSVVAASGRLEGEAGESYRLLLSEGFSPPIATALARSYPEERIRRQSEWLSRRKATQNRLGLLRRAIEEDWPEPQGASPPVSTTSEPPPGVRTSEHSPAARFAAYAYAGWADNPGPPASTPSATDLRAAEPFVARLLEVWPDDTMIPTWGRQFGASVRKTVRTSEHSGSPLPKSIAVALRAHGDEFYLAFAERRRREERQAIAAARKEHQEQFASAYQTYIWAKERELRQSHPAVYASFLDEEMRQRARLASTLPEGSQLRQVALQTFDQESDHRERLLSFLQKHKEVQVVDFWAWDAQLNPERFDPHRA